MSDFFPAGYTEDDRLQAVKLWYQGGQIAMIVVLPRKVAALARPSFLTAADFANVLSVIKDERRVVVQMPKFEVSATSASEYRHLTAKEKEPWNAIAQNQNPSSFFTQTNRREYRAGRGGPLFSWAVQIAHHLSETP